MIFLIIVMEDINKIVIYQDPAKLSNEQIYQNIEVQRRLNKNKECKISYVKNNYGIYEITLTFSKPKRKNLVEILKKLFKNLKNNCKIIFVKIKQNIFLKKVVQIMEKLSISELFKCTKISNDTLCEVLKANANQNSIVDKINVSQADLKYKYANPFDSYVDEEEQLIEKQIDNQKQNLNSNLNSYGTKEIKKNKFNMVKGFQNIIDASIQREHEKYENKQVQKKDSKMYGNYKPTKTFKPL